MKVSQESSLFYQGKATAAIIVTQQNCYSKNNFQSLIVKLHLDEARISFSFDVKGDCYH